MVTKKIMLMVAVIATATALVFGTSSFDKKPVIDNKSLANITFKYVPPTLGDYTDASVKAIANWQPGNPGCSSQDVRACTIDVPQSETTNNGTQLKSTVVISTGTADFTNYYVSGGTNVAAHVNKN